MKRFFQIFIVIGLVTALIVVVITLPSISPLARAAGPWSAGPGNSDGNDCLSPATNSATMSGVITPIITFNAGDQVCKLTKYAGNPVLPVGPNGTWDNDAAREPTVLKEGSLYNMWYTGNDGVISRIGYATSPDGLTWAKDGGNPVLSPSENWETKGIIGASVISDTDLYKMWYTGFDSNGMGRIGYATSPDGVAWTKYGAIRYWIWDLAVAGKMYMF